MLRSTPFLDATGSDTNVALNSVCCGAVTTDAGEMTKLFVGPATRFKYFQGTR